MSISNPDYMDSSPSNTHILRGDRCPSHQLNICVGTSSHDSSKDNPLIEAKRNIVRWSHDLSIQSPS